MRGARVRHVFAARLFHFGARERALALPILALEFRDACALCGQLLRAVVDARLLHDVGELCVEIAAGTCGRAEIAMSEYGLLPHRVKLVDGAKRCDEMCRRR